MKQQKMKGWIFKAIAFFAAMVMGLTQMVAPVRAATTTYSFGQSKYKICEGNTTHKISDIKVTKKITEDIQEGSKPYSTTTESFIVAVGDSKRIKEKEVSGTFTNNSWELNWWEGGAIPHPCQDEPGGYCNWVSSAQEPVTLTIKGDTLSEPDETVTLSLDKGKATASLTIIDDDAPAIEPISPYAQNLLQLVANNKDFPYEVTEAPVLAPGYDLIVLLGNDANGNGFLTSLNTDVTVEEKDGTTGLKNDGDIILTPDDTIQHPGQMSGLIINEDGGGSAYFVKGKTLAAVTLPAEGGYSLNEEWEIGADEKIKANLLPPVLVFDRLHIIDEEGNYYKVKTEQTDVTNVEGQVEYTNTIQAGTVNSAPVSDGKYLFYVLDNRYLIALDLATGGENSRIDLYNYPKAGGKNNTVSSPLWAVEAGDVGLVVTTKGIPNPIQTLEVFSTETGQLAPKSNSKIAASAGTPSYEAFPWPIKSDYGLTDYGFAFSSMQTSNAKPPNKCLQGLYLSNNLFTFDLDTAKNSNVTFPVEKIGKTPFLIPFQYVSEVPVTQKNPFSFLRASGSMIEVFQESGNGLKLIHRYKIDLDITAPPVVDNQGFVYITGKGTDGNYYLAQFKNIAAN